MGTPGVRRRRYAVVLGVVVLGWFSGGALAASAEDGASSVTVQPPYSGGSTDRFGYEGSSPSCETPNPFGADCTSTSSWSPEGALIAELALDSGEHGTLVRPMYNPVHDLGQEATLRITVERDAPTSGIVVRVPFDVASVDVEHAASLGSSAAGVSVRAWASYPGCGFNACRGGADLTLAAGGAGSHELVVNVTPPMGQTMMPAGTLSIVVTVEARVRLKAVEAASVDTPETPGVDLPGDEICLVSTRPPSLCVSRVSVPSQSESADVVRGYATARVRANVPEILVTFAP